ncbi:MAG: hypothetical protein HY235_08740 [Acidobacteria bacterium]|nr:hypothetical protein [Acidobacteriota bacterium]
MENISPDELALELVHQCLRGNDYPSELLETLLRMALSRDEEVARKASHALFRTVVERLSDEFEPCLCDCYAALFSHAIAYALPELRAGDLAARYRRVRLERRFQGDARTVFVLSRVTLGADVAVTSLVLDAAKKRFPRAGIVFAGPQKNFELFAADPRLRHLPVSYVREGSLSYRLSVFSSLRDALAGPGSIVIDPDSRLTQLGLLPVCPEEQYFFFESRGYGEYGSEPLTSLARRWLEETFGIGGASAYIAPAESAPAAEATISLGVGENPAKRIADPFERELMCELGRRSKTILADRGGSSEESIRVDHAVAGLANVRTWTGAFAPFAAAIARSRLYCGYDSAGQHVAAACGVPRLIIFAGFPSERFLARWRPEGAGPQEVIAVNVAEPAAVLAQARSALDRLSGI